MSYALRLNGYALSVYTRTVRMVLAAKGPRYEYVGCDPFDADARTGLAGLHPFERVPVLEAGDFRIWETQAILDYLEICAPEPRLRPEGARALARMRQVMGVADSYVYLPLVRQAFAQGVLARLQGEAGDPAEAAAGLAEAVRILDALEVIAAEGYVLQAGCLCLSSCHLWPMLDYFRMVPAGAEMIVACPALSDWCGWMETCPEARQTRPDLTKEAMA